MISDWVEDAALGVAAREVGGDLQVKALTQAGQARITAAKLAAGIPLDEEPFGWGAEGLSIRPDCDRLAFARALGLVEGVQA